MFGRCCSLIIFIRTMPRARPFLFEGSQAGCFHVVSRLIERRYLLDEEGKEVFLRMVRAYEDLLGVEVLTFCIMSNHFHLLVRVPHRPEGFDVPLDTLLARLERALGQEAMALVRSQLEFWQRTGLDSVIEEWRQKQIARMFSLSEFVKCVKMRFTRWYNRKTGRKGPLWESRFTSVIVQSSEYSSWNVPAPASAVEEEERALRTMAAYIDLNPVRAGMVSDPADYRWSGYAEAMAGKARARRGLVRIIGQSAWPRGQEKDSGFKVPGPEGPPETPVKWEAKPWGAEAFPSVVERRALVYYRALLGGQGAERKREDGTVVRRGLPAKTRQRLITPKERQITAEILTRRIQHFTKGVLLGSRSFIDGWFAQHREIVTGRSRITRQRGSKPLGRPALRGLYSLRDPKSG
jgi:REP element-mobilizing transposase RayT